MIRKRERKPWDYASHTLANAERLISIKGVYKYEYALKMGQGTRLLRSLRQSLKVFVLISIK